MEEFTNYLTAKGYSQRSIKSFIYCVEKLLEWLKTQHVLPQYVTYNRLLSYIKIQKQKGNSHRYINGQLNAIRHYFDYLMVQKAIPDNPAADLHLKGVTTRLPHSLFTEKQLAALYQNYPENKPIQQQIVGLLVFQGLRQREIERIEPQDFNLTNHTLFVQGDQRTASRTLALNSHQVIPLTQYLKNRNSFTERPVKYLLNSLYSYFKESEVPNLHHIRASVISNWLKHHNLRQVQYLAGHKYISSTEKYQSTQPEALQKAINQYHPLK